jgi:hypothetical protein
MHNLPSTRTFAQMHACVLACVSLSLSLSFIVYMYIYKIAGHNRVKWVNFFSYSHTGNMDFREFV